MMDSNENSPQQSERQTLLLPAPSTDETTSLEIGGQPVQLDALGPMVVNSDGTISRIANWPNLTDEEKKRTLRVLGARNRIRFAQAEAKLGQQDSTTSNPEP